MRNRLRISVFGGLCLSGLLQASSSVPLEADFLTYLAEMVREDEVWVDPLTVAEMEEMGLWSGSGATAEEAASATKRDEAEEGAK